jgi:hypothetical protein
MDWAVEEQAPQRNHISVLLAEDGRSLAVPGGMPLIDRTGAGVHPTLAFPVHLWATVSVGNTGR